MLQELPAWLAQLLQPADDSKDEQTSEARTRQATARLALPSLLAASDESVFAAALLSRPEGAPWLLQPLVRTPTLVVGESSSRWSPSSELRLVLKPCHAPCM